VHWKTSKFQIAILLFARLSPANSIKNSIYFYKIILLHYTIHVLEHNFTRIFEESAKLDMFLLPRPSEYNFRMPFRCCSAPTESVLGAHMHESSTHRFLQTLEPRDTCDQWLSIDNHGRLMQLCFSNASINSSHHCSHAVLAYSTKQDSLLNQITLHVVTCAVELSNDVVWLNLVIFISLCALFLLMISDISCPEKNLKLR